MAKALFVGTVGLFVIFVAMGDFDEKPLILWHIEFSWAGPSTIETPTKLTHTMPPEAGSPAFAPYGAPASLRALTPANVVIFRAGEPPTRDQTIDDVIADCDGDARAVVGELLAIVRSLIHENQALREVASPGLRANGLSYSAGRNNALRTTPVRASQRRVRRFRLGAVEFRPPCRRCAARPVDRPPRSLPSRRSASLGLIQACRSPGFSELWNKTATRALRSNAQIIAFHNQRVAF
jgi:hypothetical protein